ncbi:hypothetical protein J7M07_09515 [bacterium]|nr:hypothetical protein [bacterium]
MPVTTTNYTKIGHDPNSTKQQRIYFYMMNNFLYSRLDSNFPTNAIFYDEDVNVYIANLLTSISDSQYHKRITKYVTPYDQVLNELLKNVSDPREKYIAYKSNADFLLISLGIFDNPKRMKPNSTPHMNFSPRAYSGRGKIYYELAQSYLYKTSSRKSAIGDVLGKLAQRFEDYASALSLLKGKYFNFYKQITPGEMYHFEQSVLKYNESDKLAKLHNRFLDIYSEYQKNQSTSLKKAINKVTNEIVEIDPSFNFRIS